MLEKYCYTRHKLTHFIKCLHLVWLSLLCVTFAGCKDDFDDSELRGQIADLDGRLTSLEKLCAQMNTNISSMQTIINALQQNDYITGVTPITEGSTTIGYTITFVKNKPITIYHGKDGEKGEKGDDGVTPQFKIENGRWMVSRDKGSTWEDAGQATGDKGEAGLPGVTPDLKIQNGRWMISCDKGSTWEDLGQATGNQGQQGADGITPQFKIEFDNWFVSFDNGTNWTFLGQATGDKGETGKDGVTPVIGIKQDIDGIYYWTLNGTWLLDNNNQKIKAEGTDGKDGLPGKDGITPLLDIKDGYWEVSYDNGITWKTLWRATGPQGERGEQGEKGEQGTPGKDGDSMFRDVDYSTSNEYVIFTLSNGEQLKIPTWYAFEELRTQCNQMNTNISSLQSIVTALENNDYVTSVTPLMEEGKAIGYTISFSKSPAIVIYHGKDGQDGTPGQNGVAPIISIKKDTDNIYYWTLNGNWLLDDSNNKIKAQGTDGKDGLDGTPGKDGNDGAQGTPGQNGVTPQLKIEKGYWYVSYEEGKWQQLGPSTTGGAFFEEVTEDEDYVHMTLNGGNTISIPKYKPLSITFSETEDIRVLPSKTYSINYTLVGSDSKTVVKALTQDGFRAVVKPTDHTQGVIEITTPPTILNSEVLIFISDGKGHTIMSSINFVEGIINVTTKSYIVEYNGGQVEVKLSTNINYTVEIPTEAQSWLSVAPKGRAAMRDEVITFIVQPNQTVRTRFANIKLIDKIGVTIETILINQEKGIAQTVYTGRGQLEQLINAEDVPLIEELIVSGALDKSDFDFMKTMPNLTKVDLRGVLTTMPEGAFRGAKTILSVRLPSMVVIPDYAFTASSITSVEIPSCVRRIGAHAFNGCPLTSLTLPSDLIIIDEYAFIGLPLKGDLVIPDKVTTIGNYAFSNCKLDGRVILGESITEIGQGAFQRCETVTGDLVIPNSVKKIGKEAFARYGLAHTNGFNGSIKIGNGLTSIPEDAFMTSKFNGTLTIGENVTDIGYRAFNDCPFLSGNLIIPDKVRTIADYAFRNCTGFTGYLLLGSSVKTIGCLSFANAAWNSTFEPCELNFSKIYSKAYSPPTLHDTNYDGIPQHSFGGAFRKRFVLGVSLPDPNPSGLYTSPKEKYEANRSWKKAYSTIEEVDFETLIK